MAAQNLIEVSHLSMSYGWKPALIDISFAIPSGVIMGVIGDNGSGKTTLFKVLAGLIQAYRGQVSILGDCNTWRAKKDIAYHASYPFYHPNSTIDRELKLYARLHREYDIDMAKQMYA